MDASLEMISETGGVLIYLAQEGRDIGLLNKIRVYALQDTGLDTVDANEQLGFPADNRTYSIVQKIFSTLHIQSVRLITNNPLKIKALEAHNITVNERVPLIISNNEYNQKYLQTKQERMGHLL